MPFQTHMNFVLPWNKTKKILLIILCFRKSLECIHWKSWDSNVLFTNLFFFFLLQFSKLVWMLCLWIRLLWAAFQKVIISIRSYKQLSPMVSTVYLSLQCFWETHKNVYSMQILDMPKLYLKQAEDNLLFKKKKKGIDGPTLVSHMSHLMVLVVSALI